MSGGWPVVRTAQCWLPIVLCAGGLNGQTCLMLSRAAITSEGTALLDLYLFSPPNAAPAALQWTFQYPPSGITSLTVEDGAELTSAGKTAICAGDKTTYNCLAVGTNTNTIANGIVAKLKVMLAPGTARPDIRIQNTQAASSSGYFIPIRMSVDCRLHLPSRGPDAK